MLAVSAARLGRDSGDEVQEAPVLKGLGFSPAGKRVWEEAALAAAVRFSRQDVPPSELNAPASKPKTPSKSPIPKNLRNAFRLLLSTLQEIFDESPYARFLASRQIATSPQAYADFLREAQAHRERRPRCC